MVLEVTPALLVESGVVKNEKSGIKILGNGSLDKEIDSESSINSQLQQQKLLMLKGGAHEGDLMIQTLVNF